MRIFKAFLTATLLAATASSLSGQSVVVPGSANPNLAGRPAGYTCCSGDAAPAQSPPWVSVVGGSTLTFSVFGFSNYAGGLGGPNNPDGNENGSLTQYGNGISAPLNVRYNALFGVFLSNADPATNPTPAALDFAGGLNFTALSPLLGQIFFIDVIVRV